MNRAPSDFRVLPIRTDEERGKWDEFAAKSSLGHMYQCFWWAEPLSRYGVRVQTLGCWKGGQQVGGALFRSIPVPFTGASITECWNGPIFLEWEPAWVEPFVCRLVEVAREMNSMAVVIRGCPRRDVHESIVAALERAGLEVKLAPGETEAILSLEGRTMNDIWKGFRKGTKWSVKKGQQGSLCVRRITSSEDLRKAHGAWIATAVRKGFTDIRPWATIEPVLRHSVDNGLGSVVASFLEERLLAAIFVAHVGKTATWVYGGYMDGCEQYHPNHVLQYESIRECIEKGMSAYNFGYLSSNSQQQPNGVDQSKLGFGAVPQQYLDTIVWERKPLMYHLIEQLKRRRFARTLEGLVKRRLIRRGEKASEAALRDKATSHRI